MALKSCLAVLAVSCQSVVAHFVFQTTNGVNTSLLFSENGLPGPAFFLPLIENITEMYMADALAQSQPRRALKFEEQQLEGGKGELVAMLPANSKAPFVLESYVPFGIFSEGGSPPHNLIYYSTAPAVRGLGDFDLLEQVMQNLLEITFRNFTAAARSWRSFYGSQDAGDGLLDVMAVVRFNGTRLAGKANVTAFDGETGDKLGIFESSDGVVDLRGLPVGKRVFAAVNYIVNTPGEIDGESYEYVDHWATTSAVFGSSISV